MTQADIITACRAIVARGDKPTVPDVLPLVSAYYAMPGNGAGGSLHIVLDDANNENGSVDWCIEHARVKQDEAGFWLACVVRMCSRTQRARLGSEHE